MNINKIREIKFLKNQSFKTQYCKFKNCKNINCTYAHKHEFLYYNRLPSIFSLLFHKIIKLNNKFYKLDGHITNVCI